MATYRDLQDRIALDYLNRMTLIPEVKRAIAVAIHTVEASRFWFNEASTALASVAGQSYAPIPSDFLVLDRLELTLSVGNFALQQTNLGTVRELNAVSITGQPTHFTYYQDRFELALVPDSAYALPCYYLKTLPALSADTDSNAWTNEAGNLIAHLACIELCSTVLRADDRAIARHERAAALARSELERRNEPRLLRRLRATSF